MFKKLTSLALAVLMAILCLPLGTLAESLEMQEAAQKRYCVLVMDISGEAEFYSGGTTLIYTADSAVEHVKEAALSFMRDIVSAPGENYVAVVTFNDDAHVLSGFTNDYDALTDRIEAIQQGGDRSICAGLEAAQGLLDDIQDPEAVKNVILVTTGMTNVGDYAYSGWYGEETVGSSWYNMATDIHLYAYANMAYDASSALKQTATVYVLGLFQVMEDMPDEGADVVEFFRVTARDLASSEDTYVDVTDPEKISFAFGSIVEEITNVNPTVHGTYRYRGNYQEDTDTPADYYYTDNYFFRDSASLDWSLASMSLALELSSWSSTESDRWYDPARPEALDDRLRNCKTLLLGAGAEAGADWEQASQEQLDDWGTRGLGFSHFRANSAWQRDPELDSIGVCAAARRIARSDEEYTLVAVVVRGGGYGSEWASNFTLGSSGEHQGFAEARNTALRWLAQEYLPSLPQEDRDRPLKLWVTGYSRAGIVANMMAGRIDEDPTCLGSAYRIAPENLYCYTFEAPQGIVEKKEGGAFRNIHNIRNAVDLVPMVAPSVWGFTRYNSSDSKGILPNPYTQDPKLYEASLAAMEAEREKLGFSSYPLHPQSYYQVSHFRFDKTKFLPFGDPMIWHEDMKLATDAIVQGGVNYIFRDLIEDRTMYRNRMEDTVRALAGIALHYDGAAAGVRAYVVRGVTVRFDIKYFLQCCKNLFTLDNVKYILKPLWSLNPFYSRADRMRDVRQNAIDVVSTTFADYSTILAAAQFSSFIDAVGGILGDAFQDIAADVWRGDTSDINTIADLAKVMFDGGMHAHFADVTLPWVRSLDPNFNPDAAPVDSGATTRVILINCPVDVRVYDQYGALQASFTDDVPEGADTQLPHYTNDNGEKVIYLPGSAAYDVEIIGREAAEVSISLSEYNFVQGGLTRLVNAYDIPVAAGESIELTAPALSERERTENSPEGSAVQYRLHRADEALPFAEELRGAEASQARHSVEIALEGNGGYAEGAGSFVQGSFAQVEAHALPGASFEGWFRDGSLVSTETVLRFAVREDTALTARFTDVEFNTLLVSADEGGRASDMEDWFCPGIEIGLEAEADAGWRFDGWSVEGDGSIDDPSSPAATFTMGTSKAHVVAHFVPEGAPETGEEAAEEVTAPAQETPVPVQETAAPVQETPEPAQDAPEAVQETPEPAQEAPAPSQEAVESIQSAAPASIPAANGAVVLLAVMLLLLTIGAAVLIPLLILKNRK